MLRRLVVPGLLIMAMVGLGRNLLASGASVQAAAPSLTTVQVIEFYHSGLDHYFMTADPIEIEALDVGILEGWARTGYEFMAYSTDSAGADLSPVCRFYGLPAAGLDSHFYSASPAECAAMLTRFASSWILESSDVFQVQMPDASTGTCADGTASVYRLWNNRPDSNHRYTTDPNVRMEMIANGYISEGYGPSGVGFCAPTLPSASISVIALAPDTFDFSAIATPSSGAQIVAYAWDFGDGGAATGAMASHQFTLSGTYPVVLTVTDSKNVATKAVKTITATTPKTLSALPANTAADLRPYQCSDAQGESPGMCGYVTDFSGMVYDQKRQRMVLFGGGHAATNYDALNTFPSSSLRWTEEYPPTPATAMTAANYDYTRGAWLRGPDGGPYPRAAARHTEDLMDVAGDELILLGVVEGNANGTASGDTTEELFTTPGRIAHYNFVSKSWTFTNVPGVKGWPASAYDPVSGKIVMLGSSTLSVYDPVAETLATAINLNSYAGLAHIVREDGSTFSQNPLRYNNNLVYFPPNQKMYYFERFGGSVYEVNLNRTDFSASTITLLNTTGTPPPSTEIGYGYDSINHIIGGGPVNNTFYGFDPGTKAWTAQTMQGGAPGTVAFHALDYDSANNVFVFITDKASGRRTWAYRYK
jgi:PKD repeat protein